MTDAEARDLLCDQLVDVLEVVSTEAVVDGDDVAFTEPEPVALSDSENVAVPAVIVVDVLGVSDSESDTISVLV